MCDIGHNLRDNAALEEAVLARIHHLMAGRTPEARREVELTNVPVIVAQVERSRSRQGIWDRRVHAYQLGKGAVATDTPQSEMEPELVWDPQGWPDDRKAGTQGRECT